MTDVLTNTLAVVLAGGQGSRLQPLTKERAKPAVPFGGKYRIIDFTLSNCLHSGLRRILVLTQYKSHSLQKHLRDGWSVFNPELGEYITNIPPQMRTGNNWYAGTADALYQNLYLIERSGADYVIVLSADHIYRMDYAPLIERHKKKNADITIACMEVEIEKATHFGVLEVDDSGKVTGFEEKPASPKPSPASASMAIASMGIYVFSTKVLIERITQDQADSQSAHDFGHSIIPSMIERDNVYSYFFGGTEGRVSQDKYWRDVGTVDNFYEANIDLLKSVPPLDLYQKNWSVRTYTGQYPPARTAPGEMGNEGIFINSIISSGSVISGGSVENSILFDNVFVGDETFVQGSILFSGVTIGRRARLKNCIVDKYVRVPDEAIVGYDKAEDKKRFFISEKGIIVIPKGYVFAEP